MAEKLRPVAVITGASSGIGVDFARELARRGYDLVLTARREDRLLAVKEELQAEHDVTILTLPSDLSTVAGAARFHAEVKRSKLDVSLLINNAGLGKFGPTLDQSVADIEAVIQVNVMALAVLTRLFAADFRERGGGYILNHSSFSAIQPPSHYSVYAGTKSFVLAFSLALRADVKRDGIRVSALCPGFFATEFFEKAEHEPSLITRLITLPPRQVARAGIRGLLRGKAVIIPGAGYRFLSLLMRCLPRTAHTSLGNFGVRH